MGKKKKEIRTVIFDLGNVLVHYDTKIAAKKFAILAKMPLAKVYFFFFTSPLEDLYTRGQISTGAFIRECQKGLGVSVNRRQFAEIWNDIFWENKGMEALLQRLKKRYPLYMISNTNELHFDYLKKNFPGIFKPFKKCFPSHRVRSRKPDREIFRRVLKAIRAKPEETVFIDDVPGFVRGARNAGMRAIRFKNQKQLLNDFKKMGIRV